MNVIKLKIYIHLHHLSKTINHVVMFLTAVERTIIKKLLVYYTGKNVLLINLCPLDGEKVNLK